MKTLSTQTIHAVSGSGSNTGNIAEGSATVGTIGAIIGGIVFGPLGALAGGAIGAGIGAGTAAAVNAQSQQ